MQSISTLMMMVGLLMVFLIIESNQLTLNSMEQTRSTRIRTRRQSMIIQSPIQSISQYTEGDVYDILSVTLLASLGSFLLPSLSTFLTYMVTSNKNLMFNNKQHRNRIQKIRRRRRKRLISIDVQNFKYI